MSLRNNDRHATLIDIDMYINTPAAVAKGRLSMLFNSFRSVTQYNNYRQDTLAFTGSICYTQT